MKETPPIFRLILKHLKFNPAVFGAGRVGLPLGYRALITYLDETEAHHDEDVRMLWKDNEELKAELREIKELLKKGNKPS